MEIISFGSTSGEEAGLNWGESFKHTSNRMMSEKLACLNNHYCFKHAYKCVRL